MPSTSVTTPVGWLFSDQSPADNQDGAGSVDSAGDPAIVPSQIGGGASSSSSVVQTSMTDDDDEGSEHDQMVWTDDETQDQPKSQFISIFVIEMSRYRKNDGIGVTQNFKSSLCASF